MVRRGGIVGFWRETDGVSLSEALITLPVVMLVFAAFVEFGFAVFQWNQAVKALQYGARMAAVSDSVNPDFDPVGAGQPDDPIYVGDAIDTSESWSCIGADPDGTSGLGICNGNLQSIFNGVKANGIVVRPGMRAIDPWMKLENVVVTYVRSGLGYWGRPEGAVVTIRMETRDMKFHLPILGGLLGLDYWFRMPAMPVTITSEDLKTCYSSCP